ncbi:hypothetical protein IQ269_07165 [Tychonema sp. LEGE 07199]|uniref:DUF6335 family protein n=1 Tax=unclassified Tychonema TaxID=2642144 RepID=UPI001880952C|nr:hypothetical protein [Tychonema sp. LEGE 07199]MBE9131962.1 hypothetical protein [Tychonema sp. LEGE 07196]
MVQQNKRAEEIAEERDNSSDLPQEITESYGTGVIVEPGLNQYEITTLNDSGSEYRSSSSQLSGDDGEVAAAEQERATGEELVGGSAPTPDQDMVDELGAAAGIEMADGAILHTTDMLEHRDESRWELDPSSAEDHQEQPDL